MAQILEGKKVAESIYQRLLLEISLLPHVPKIVFILIGKDVASQTYVRAKSKKCVDLGIRSETKELNESVPEEEVLKLIDQLNADPDVHGILVQLPLPKHLNKHTILNRVSPLKDVDGLHPENVGLLMQGKPRFAPCTPAGIMELFTFYNVSLAGAHVVVIGRSEIVGKPMGLLCLNADATVTICHSKTRNLSALTTQADILIAAVGKPEMIDSSFVKKDAVVIDVGIHRKNEKLVGDVHFASVSTVASALTPVPGGVGPMTIAKLMENLVRAVTIRR